MATVTRRDPFNKELCDCTDYIMSIEGWSKEDINNSDKYIRAMAVALKHECVLEEELCLKVTEYLAPAADDIIATIILQISTEIWKAYEEINGKTHKMSPRMSAGRGGTGGGIFNCLFANKLPKDITVVPVTEMDGVWSIQIKDVPSHIWFTKMEEIDGAIEIYVTDECRATDEIVKTYFSYSMQCGCFSKDANYLRTETKRHGLGRAKSQTTCIVGELSGERFEWTVENNIEKYSNPNKKRKISASKIKDILY